jgi:hypothetical protein
MTTNKQKFNLMSKQDKNQPNSKEDIFKLTKIPIKFLDEIYSRGIEAYENTTKNIKKIPKEAWAMARIYAFVVKRRQGALDFDLDVSSDIRKFQRKEKEKKENK